MDRAGMWYIHSLSILMNLTKDSVRVGVEAGQGKILGPQGAAEAQ